MNDSLYQQSTNSILNKFKRASVETGLSSTSDYGLIYSHQSSIDQQAIDTFAKPSRPLDINDFNHGNDKNGVDNEIFYLEREIFDYNQ